MISKMFLVTRSRRSGLRKLPFLPRLGLTVDVGGWQLTYRQTPLLEALANLRGAGFSTKAFRKAWSDALDEIRFPGGAQTNLASVEKLRPRAADHKPASGKAPATKAAPKRRSQRDDRT